MPVTCRDPAQIRSMPRFFKARTRRPKHVANDYWTRRANTPALMVNPVRVAISKGFRNVAAKRPV